MYMRLGFAIATHLDADVLLLDEVFAVGDEAFQRKCFGKIFEFKSRGGTIVFVSHDAAAVERLCERAILLRAGQRRVRRRRRTTRCGATTRCWPRTSDPAERERRPAGVGERGGAGRPSIRLEDADGSRAAQFLSGEPLVAAASRRGRAAPARPRGSPSSSATPPAPCWARPRRTLGELGWSTDGTGDWVRFEIDSLPLADGRFQVSRRARRTPAGTSTTASQRAAEFVVYPDADSRGRFGWTASWALADAPAAVESGVSSRTCPDWPSLIELAPELQFKHYTVAEARLPADTLIKLAGMPLSTVAICADLEHNVFNAQHTDPAVVEALRPTHWFELAEWSTTGPGTVRDF